MISRRRLLAAAGVALVGGGAGVAGVESAPGRKALHSLGLLHSSDKAVPSVARPLSVSAGVLPVSGRRYRIVRTGSGGGAPVWSVACLHGRGRDERFPFEALGVHRFAAALGLDVVVASLHGGSSSYWHGRRVGGDPMAALADELVPLMDRLSGGGPRAVFGWSMGGYGALLAGEQLGSLFQVVVASSPAVWRRFGDAAPGAFDSAADFAAHDVLRGAVRLGGVRVRIDCGESDPFASTSREMLRSVPGAVGGLRPGFHDDQFWRSVLPEQLKMLA